MYCLNCKEEHSNQYEICPICGKKLVPNHFDPTDMNKAYDLRIDEPNKNLIWIGILLPYLALFLYLNLKDTKPNSAKMMLKGVWILLGIGLLFTIIIMKRMYYH